MRLRDFEIAHAIPDPNCNQRPTVMKRALLRQARHQLGLSMSQSSRFTLPRWAPSRCATHHMLGTQTYKDPAGRQIATLFERAAWFERSLRKAGASVRVHESVRNAWTKWSLSRHARHSVTLPEPATHIGDSHHVLEDIAQNFEPRT